MTIRYAVIVEEGATGFGAYVPDLPGCVAAVDTREDVIHLIQDAIGFHVEGLKENGKTIPAPVSSVEFVDAAA